MSDDEYYKYFYTAESLEKKEDIKDSFSDEFLIKGGYENEAEPVAEAEPKQQTSDMIGKSVLKDIINKQLDKEWDMEKIIMKYQLSPEQLDKILYESKGWESQIIGGEDNHQDSIVVGGYIDLENFKKMVNNYLRLFEISWDFLTRYLRSFQIIAEVTENGGENRFLPKTNLTLKQNEETLSQFLKIIEEIRHSAEVPLSFSNIKIDRKILEDFLMNTGIQHHHRDLTKLVQTESTNAADSLIKAAKSDVFAKHAFINEIYKYDLRDPKRFYSDGIHKNAINKYAFYKKFIEKTTSTLGENFIDILISIYKILMNCMDYYETLKKNDPSFVIPELEANFSTRDQKIYIKFLEDVRKFLRNPNQRNAANSKNLIKKNINSFNFKTQSLPKSEIIAVEKDKIVEIISAEKGCNLGLEPNVSGYLNIADFIEEPKDEIVEKTPEDISEDIVEKIPETIVEKIPETIVEKTPEDISEDISKDISKDIVEKVEEPFDIMHMITDPTSLATLITPVPPPPPEKVPVPPPALSIPDFKKFVITPPAKIPDAPVAPSIPDFKKFIITPPAKIPDAPVPMPIPDFKKFVIIPPKQIPVPPVPPVIRGFKPLVIPPKPIVNTGFASANYGLIINNEIDDSSIKIPIEYRVLPKLSEKKDPYRIKVMFIMAYNILHTAGEVGGKTLSDLAQYVGSFSGKTDQFLNDLILEYLTSAGFTYASSDALFVYVKYLKNKGIPLIDRSDIYNFVKAYDILTEKIYSSKI